MRNFTLGLICGLILASAGSYAWDPCADNSLLAPRQQQLERQRLEDEKQYWQDRWFLDPDRANPRSRR